MKNLRSKKKLIIIISCVIIFILLIVFIKSISSSKKVTGDRCSDADNYRLSNNTLNKAMLKILIFIRNYVQLR